MWPRVVALPPHGIHCPPEEFPRRHLQKRHQAGQPPRPAKKVRKVAHGVLEIRIRVSVAFDDFFDLAHCAEDIDRVRVRVQVFSVFRWFSDAEQSAA